MGAEAPACPCRKPSTVRTWESDLYLCSVHARLWLRSEEKKIAVVAIEEKNEDALRGAVEAFVGRISERPGVWERLKTAWNGLAGRTP